MIGHTLRHDSLLKLIIEEYMNGKTGRERPRIEYISQIMNDMNMGSYLDLKALSLAEKLESCDQLIKRLKTKKNELVRTFISIE